MKISPWGWSRITEKNSLQITLYHTVLEMLTIVIIIVIVVVIIVVIIVTIIVIVVVIIVPGNKIAGDKDEVVLAGRCLEHNSNLSQND